MSGADVVLIEDGEEPRDLVKTLKQNRVMNARDYRHGAKRVPAVGVDRHHAMTPTSTNSSGSRSTNPASKESKRMKDHKMLGSLEKRKLRPMGTANDPDVFLNTIQQVTQKYKAHEVIPLREAAKKRKNRKFGLIRLSTFHQEQFHKEYTRKLETRKYSDSGDRQRIPAADSHLRKSVPLKPTYDNNYNSSPLQ